MTSRAYRNDRWLIASALLMLAVPLLWPAIPPLTDLPGHMASYHLSLHLDRSPDLQRYFAFEWQLIGNLGVNLLVAGFGRLLDVETATKAAVLLIPVLTGLGFLLLSRQAHGGVQPTALVALPLAYNYPFLFGFVNYALAAALAVLGLALWLRWPAERRPAPRAAAFAALAALIWLAHAIGWIMLGAMCGAAELHRRWTTSRSWGAPLAGTALACLPLAAPVLLVAAGPRSAGFTASEWLDWFALAKWTVMLFRDRWVLLDLASVALTGGLIGLAMLRVGGLRLASTLAWPALALFVLFILAPQSINGSGFVSARLVPYAAALAIVAIDTAGVREPGRRLLAWCAAGFFAVRMAAVTASLFLFDQSWKRELVALEHIPHGAAVLTLTEDPCRSGLGNWTASRLSHLSGMAVVRRDAFVNSIWSVPGLHLTRTLYRQAEPFVSDPSARVVAPDCPGRVERSASAALTLMPEGAFDRLWLLGVPRRDWPDDPRFALLWSSDRSALYAIRPRGGGAEAPR